MTGGCAGGGGIVGVSQGNVMRMLPPKSIPCSWLLLIQSVYGMFVEGFQSLHCKSVAVMRSQSLAPTPVRLTQQAQPRVAQQLRNLAIASAALHQGEFDEDEDEGEDYEDEDEGEGGEQDDDSDIEHQGIGGIPQ
jgi:hypothetical protein